MDPAEIAKLKELAKQEQVNVLHDDSIDFLRTEDDEKREENEQAAVEAAKDLDLDLGIVGEDGQEPTSTKVQDYEEEESNYVRSKARQQIRK
jgi:hypothetical protein